MNQQYRILRAHTVSNLETSVNQATAEGWAPLGGVSAVYVGSNTTVFYQTMIKYNGELVNEIKEIKNELRGGFSDEKIIKLYQLIDLL